MFLYISALGFGPNTQEGEGAKLMMAILGLLSTVSFPLSSLFGGTFPPEQMEGRPTPGSQSSFPERQLCSWRRVWMPANVAWKLMI